MVLISMSLRNDDVEYILMCFSAMCMYILWRNAYSNHLPIFIVLLVFSCKSSLIYFGYFTFMTRVAAKQNRLA